VRPALTFRLDRHGPITQDRDEAPPRNGPVAGGNEWRP
jgi:hypothetical protein